MEKIAFVGDSYCVNHDSGSWLDIVLKEYNAEMICRGRGGGCLFHSYEDLLNIVNEADYIIFCITAYTRLPNRYAINIDPKYLGGGKTWDLNKVSTANNELLRKHNNGMHYTQGSNDVLDKEEPIPPHALKRIVKAAELYYKYFMSLDFHQVAQKGILMQIDELMLQKKKKCIWFPCFENELSMLSYRPKSGPIANTDLATISNKEQEHDNEAQKLLNKYIKQGRDPRCNHLNEEHNKKLAQVVIDIIETNNFSPHEIKMEDYFLILSRVERIRT
jgi:hypothetical protein